MPDCPDPERLADCAEAVSAAFSEARGEPGEALTPLVTAFGRSFRMAEDDLARPWAERPDRLRGEMGIESAPRGSRQQLRSTREPSLVVSLLQR